MIELSRTSGKPFLIFASMGLYFFLIIRRAKARHQPSAVQLVEIIM